MSAISAAIPTTLNPTQASAMPMVLCGDLVDHVGIRDVLHPLYRLKRCLERFHQEREDSHRRDEIEDDCRVVSVMGQASPHERRHADDRNQRDTQHKDSPDGHGPALRSTTFPLPDSSCAPTPSAIQSMPADRLCGDEDAELHWAEDLGTTSVQTRVIVQVTTWPPSSAPRFRATRWPDSSEGLAAPFSPDAVRTTFRTRNAGSKSNVDGCPPGGRNRNRQQSGPGLPILGRRGFVDARLGCCGRHQSNAAKRLCRGENAFLFGHASKRRAGNAPGRRPAKHGFLVDGGPGMEGDIFDP